MSAPHGPAPQKPELAAAYNALVSAARAKQSEAATPPRRTSRIALLLLGVTIVVGAAVWRLSVPSPARTDPATPAEMRGRMLVVARQIAAFQAEHGRYPRALRELPGAPGFLAYRLVNAETWELRAAIGGDSIRLRRGDDATRFLADTREPARP